MQPVAVYIDDRIASTDKGGTRNSGCACRLEAVSGTGNGVPPLRECVVDFKAERVNVEDHEGVGRVLDGVALLRGESGDEESVDGAQISKRAVMWGVVVPIPTFCASRDAVRQEKNSKSVKKQANR